MNDMSVCLAEIKANPKKFYVYILYRPSGRPFYVGCGEAHGNKHERIQDHEMMAWRRKKCRRSIIIRSILNHDLLVGYSIDSWHDTCDDVFAREMALIKELGRKPAGLLVNGNDGGTGQFNPSDEVRKRMSEARRRMIDADPDFSRKMSERQRAIMNRPGVRAKLAASTKRQYENPARRKLSAENARKQGLQPGATAAFLKRVEPFLEAAIKKSVAVRRADPTYAIRMSEIKKAKAVYKYSLRRKCIDAVKETSSQFQLPDHRASEKMWEMVALRFGVEIKPNVT